MANGSSRLQGLLALLLLSGCAEPPGTVSLDQVARFSLGPNTSEATNATVAPTSAAPIRLYGQAIVPEALSDAANLDDGHVTGAQVLVRDATNGQALA
ncbi:MAG TPA: hypothetical protein V6D47_15045, partial [Oscillatoriaceae cyanobacterium]